MPALCAATSAARLRSGIFWRLSSSVPSISVAIIRMTGTCKFSHARLAISMSFVTHLECTRCATRYEAGQVHNLCNCGGPLYVRYDLAAANQAFPRGSVASGPCTMWRYKGVLPARDPVSLGEGMTPMIHASRLGAKYSTDSLYVKD